MRAIGRYRSDQHAMIGALQEIATDGEQRGSGITRIWANMGWALGDFPGVHDIVEYESRLNYVLPKYDIAHIGSYRREGLAGKSFLRPPDEFLAELRGGNATVATVADVE
jgi:hypothetical protein